MGVLYDKSYLVSLCGVLVFAFLLRTFLFVSPLEMGSIWKG